MGKRDRKHRSESTLMPDLASVMPGINSMPVQNPFQRIFTTLAVPSLKDSHPSPELKSVHPDPERPPAAHIC
jgi:hypothetical protein